MNDMKNYIMGESIGHGSAGDIYKAKVIKMKKYVAIKVQKEGEVDVISNEYKIYKAIQGGIGIPRIEAIGMVKGRVAIAMEYLGHPLSKLYTKCNSQFTLKTVLILADQMIQRLEFIHSRDIIHRDLKPGNFLMGIAEKVNWVYLIDFGLATSFVDERTDEHIPFAEKVEFMGNLKNCSYNALKHHQQSRRDDMESLGYVLLNFLKPLPWAGVRGKTDTRDVEAIRKEIIQIKLNTSLDVLCKPYPSVFLTYLKYCRNLKFDESPDYSYLRELFKNFFKNEMKFTFDYDYDWCKINVEKASRKEKLNLGEPSGTDGPSSSKREKKDN